MAAGWMSLSEVITIMKLFVVNDVRNAVKFSFMTVRFLKFARHFPQDSLNCLMMFETSCERFDF